MVQVVSWARCHCVGQGFGLENGASHEEAGQAGA